MTSVAQSDDVKWRPSAAGYALKDDSPIAKLAQIISRKYDVTFDNYWDLHKWSVDNYDKFWHEVWQFCGVVSSKGYAEVVDTSKNISQVPKWFSGSHLNYAENILVKNDDAKIAVYSAAEAFAGELRSITFGTLKQQVRAYAAALKKHGVSQGDRVAGYMPNTVECLVAMLATASLGAVWSSSSLDFGTTAVTDRLSQVEPKVLFTVEATMYNGKRHDNLCKLGDISKKLTSVEKVVLIPYVTQESEIDASSIRNCIFLREFLCSKNNDDQRNSELRFEQVPFDHPLFVMFSSGTTGPPKCMVHSVGGTLLKHLEEHTIQSDLQSGDILLFYTTTGWMMWNWLVSALATGCSIVLYDGSPFFPNPAVLFDLVSTVGVTALGLGAKCYATYESKGVVPVKTHNLAKLRILFSTGSPLKPQSYDYIYSKIKEDVLVASISGGTDIIACFIGNTWSLPVRRGMIQCPFLGCQIESWDETGKKVLDERGELVCVKPFPSMPTHFLADPDDSKYKNAYFTKFPGAWAHGDLCIIDSNSGGILMLGRSDNTLNPGGVRFGSAEIYHVVEAFPDVEDSICVSQKIGQDDERVVLFVKMKNGVTFGPELESNIRLAIRRELSARHVPAVISTVADIPHTSSGKKVETAVKRIVNGETVRNVEHLANPDSLRFFCNLPELKLVYPSTDQQRINGTTVNDN